MVEEHLLASQSYATMRITMGSKLQIHGVNAGIVCCETRNSISSKETAILLRELLLSKCVSEATLRASPHPAPHRGQIAARALLCASRGAP